MSKNISFLGADYSDVPAVILPQTGGGTARFDDASVTTAVAEDVASGKIFLAADGTITTGTGSGGAGMTLIGTLPDEQIALADTDFNGWTPSTTAKAILASEAVGTFVATDLPDWDYFIQQRCYCELAYTDSSNSKGKLRRACMDNWYSLTRRPSNNANYDAENFNSGVAENMVNTYIENYYNAGWVVLTSSAYGIYPSTVAPSFSSATAQSPTITVNRMTINAKCNATYFATAWAGKVIQNQSYLKFKYYIYRRESGFGRRLVYDSLVDMYNNGLTVVIPESE